MYTVNMSFWSQNVAKMSRRKTKTVSVVKNINSIPTEIVFTEMPGRFVKVIAVPLGRPLSESIHFLIDKTSKKLIVDGQTIGRVKTIPKKQV